MIPLYRITKLKAEPHRADDFHDDIEAHPNASEAAVLLAQPTGQVEQLSHAKILGAAQSLSEKVQLGRNDRIGLVSSFSTAGSQAGFWAGIQSGAVSVVPAVKFEKEEVLNSLENEKVTVVLGEKSEIDELLANGLRERVPTVIHVVSVGKDLSFQVHN